MDSKEVVESGHYGFCLKCEEPCGVEAEIVSTPGSESGSHIEYFSDCCGAPAVKSLLTKERFFYNDPVFGPECDPDFEDDHNRCFY